MDLTTTLPALFGGHLCLLVVGHFVCDWLFQGHKEALKKAENWRVRLLHCAFYAFTMHIWLRFFWGYQRYFWLLAIMVAVWLLVTHFFIDTYLPTYWWMRYVRRPPLVVEKGREGFKEYAQTPLGLVLIVVVDQIWHVLALLPVVFLLQIWADVYVPLP